MPGKKFKHVGTYNKKEDAETKRGEKETRFTREKTVGGKKRFFVFDSK